MATSRGGTYQKNRKKVIEQNMQKFGRYTCEYCSKAPLYRNAPGACMSRPNLLTVDHIIPIKYNGSNGASNLKVCCFECNLKKGGELV